MMSQWVSYQLTKYESKTFPTRLYYKDKYVSACEVVHLLQLKCLNMQVTKIITILKH